MARRNGGSDEFWAKYQRPEWQRKAAQIRERANYECEWCGDKESQLDVHHSYYEKDADPWDYPDESLHCLCKKCHKEQQELKREINRQFGKLGLGNMQGVLGFLQGLEMSDWPMVETKLLSREHAEGIGMAFGLSEDSVVEAAQNDVVDGFMLSHMAGPYFVRFKDSRPISDERMLAIRSNRERRVVASEATTVTIFQKIEPWNCAATG